MNEETPQPTRELRVFATNNADELGYLGQEAIAAAAPPGDDYRIVGGHMVRLLLEAHPTSVATSSTELACLGQSHYVRVTDSLTGSGTFLMFTQ